MKIFNVAIRVSIQQIAVLPDDPTDGDAKPAKEAFNDDPLDKQDKILTKYMDRMEAIAGPQVPRMVAPQGDSAGMVRQRSDCGLGLWRTAEDPCGVRRNDKKAPRHS